MTADPEYFKHCTTCKKPIAFSAPYYQCSVSTCNRKRLGMYFCGVPCWDAHVPMMRHRDAWAEQVFAPAKADHLRELAAESAREREGEQRAMANESEPRRRIVGELAEAPPAEVLVVVSKLKAYVKARSGMNTSDGVTTVLSAHLRNLCDRAVHHANSEGRKTVMDRDFEAILKET